MSFGTVVNVKLYLKKCTIFATQEECENISGKRCISRCDKRGKSVLAKKRSHDEMLRLAKTRGSKSEIRDHLQELASSMGHLDAHTAAQRNQIAWEMGANNYSSCEGQCPVLRDWTSGGDAYRFAWRWTFITTAYCRLHHVGNATPIACGR